MTLDLQNAVSKFIDRATAKRGQYLTAGSSTLIDILYIVLDNPIVKDYKNFNERKYKYGKTKKNNT